MTANSECPEALKNDPEALRSFQKFISNADPDTLSALSGGKGENPYTSPLKNGFGPGSVHPNVTPDMLKSATDMITKMPPEELQKMFEAVASLKRNDSISTSTAVKSSTLDSDAEVKYPEFQTASVSNGNNGFGETSSSSRFPNPMSSQSNLPTSTADLQEQMRNQMEDPAMLQMFASMMKNMSPDIMENMGEQFGLKLSREDARAQQAMASLSPEELDRKMCWADRIQKGAEGAKKAKNWLLGKPGMILALCMLILAVVLHRLGFIGRLNYLNLHFERESPWKFNFRNYSMLLGLQGGKGSNLSNTFSRLKNGVLCCIDERGGRDFFQM
ncbi:outer envelope protein 61 [Gossypium australe]|uniref:Outer envelope protein 61 n=1 Tax=Gossypium australe TaxID=47621 RepID=A0A5B6X6G5_9ROSI|nr:outer envelope protein 61 [Gossypium australe]